MIRSIFLLLLAALLLPFFATRADAGPILEADPADQMILPGGLNTGYYDSLYTYTLGRLHRSDNADAVEGFPLPYLAPGQQITGATISYYLIGKNNSPVCNLQVYGMTRVSTTSASPIPGDYYCGPNDTANTLLDAKFITPSTPVGTVSYSGANIASWLQKQYANPAFTGLDQAKNRYVFLRVSPDASGTDWYNYIVASGRNPNRLYHPRLAIQISNGLTATAGRLQFSFNLPTSAITSAGVYNTSTGTLVRTLWNSIEYQAGMNYGAWDGKDDSGNVLPTGTNYQVQLIYHNVTYVWDGTVGNTSTNQTGYGVWHSDKRICNMCNVGNYMYTVSSYDELFDPCMRFKIGDPQNYIPATSTFLRDPFSMINFVTADATHAYYAKCAGGLVGWANTYIFAYNTGDLNPYTFPKGVKPTGANQYYSSAIDFDGSANPDSATGIAVQKTGNYLFVAHGAKNLVRVFDKTQGNLVASFAVTAAGQMATTANNDVWIISNTTPPKILRYTFSGTTATLKDTITSVVAPVGLGVSADDSLLLVTDGGTSQQVKAFTNSNGNAAWTFGLAGGMQVNGPNIVNNCFDWGPQSYVAFQPDNSFWVGDWGNSRLMHFSYSGSTVSYVDMVAYIPISYDVAVDYNNPTRVINQFIEHTVDYSKPLGGLNGSWKLNKNWAYGLPSDALHNYFSFQEGIKNVVTLSNGHTYALMRNFATTNSDLFELPANGFARPTGYSYPDNTRIYQDGTIRTAYNNHGTSAGTIMSYYSASLTGFDAKNNPKWSSPALLAAVPIAANQPQSWYGTYPERTEVTASGMVVDYDPNQSHTGYHLGVVASGGTSFKWLAFPSGPANYSGWWMQDGHFDIANGITYGGDVAMAMGSHILTGYHGEFWRAGEASQWVDWYDNGLMLAHFGTYGAAGFNTQVALDGFAGNSYSPDLCRYNGQVYLYSNDESNHGGTIRWKINGWDNVTTLAATGAVGGVTSLSSGAGGPTVTLTSPTQNGQYDNGRAIVMTASASDSSGVAVSSVEFFDGTTSLGTATTAPYSITTSSMAPGSHVITAKASDGSKSATSPAVSIVIGGDGSSTPPPAPATLVSNGASSSSVSLSWTQPATSSTSSTTGQILSFQFDMPGDVNALQPTEVAGAPGYAVSNFFQLPYTATAFSGQLFYSPKTSTGVTVSNLSANLGLVLSGDPGSYAQLPGTAKKLFAAEVSSAYSQAVAVSLANIPFGVYDLVVYSQPSGLNKGPGTASINVSDNNTSTTVNQTFNALPTGYATASVAFGSSTTVTNCNVIVVRGLTSTSLRLQGGNLAAMQLVQRPYDQGVPSSYSIERATGTSGAFAQVGTNTGTDLTYTDSTVSANTSYQYRVRAINSFGSSPYSNTVTVTTSTSTASTASTGTTTTGTSGGTTSSGSTSTGSTSTGTTSGSTTSTGTTTSSTATTGTTTPTTSTQTGFQKWQAKYFTAAQLADATVSGPSADPYGSGVPNLLAYALQLDPSTARPTDVPYAHIEGSHLVMTYFQPNAITDVTYVVEVSTDLVTWNSGTGYTSVATTAVSSTGVAPRVVDQLPVTSQKHFMRLRVSQK